MSLTEFAKGSARLVLGLSLLLVQACPEGRRATAADSLHETSSDTLQPGVDVNPGGEVGGDRMGSPDHLEERQRPDGWTEATHGNDVAPDYSVVFPDSAVLRMDVRFDAATWAALLADMEGLYGEFGEIGSGGPQQPDVPQELVQACLSLVQGDACDATFEGNPIAGTCREVWEGLLACIPEGSAPVNDPLAAACAEKQAGDECSVGTGPMGPSGTCQGNATLVCIIPPATDACLGLVAGDPCEMPTPEGEKPGHCAEMGPYLACMMQSAPPGGPGVGGDIVETNPIWAPCEIGFEGKNWWHVGFRFKGNSTLSLTWGMGSYKLPFKLDFDQFEDQYPMIKNQRFFGFKKLSFANNARDDSLLREKLGGDLFAAAGIPTPRRTFVRVYLDVGQGPLYLGLYTMAETPDEPMLQRIFGESEGNLYKPEGKQATWAHGITIDETGFSKETNEEKADWSDVEGAMGALHADRTDASTWRQGLDERFSADTFLNWLAVNTVIQDWDQYGNGAHNYYLYGTTKENGRFYWIPWDHNESLKGGGGMMGPLPLDMSGVTSEWPLIRFLIDDPLYGVKYWAYVSAFADGPFSSEAFEVKLQAAHDMIRPYVLEQIGVEWIGPLAVSSDAFDAALLELKQHVALRRDAVDMATSK